MSPLFLAKAAALAAEAAWRTPFRTLRAATALIANTGDRQLELQWVGSLTHVSDTPLRAGIDGRPDTETMNRSVEMAAGRVQPVAGSTPLRPMRPVKPTPPVRGT
jgi:hypothetical protein